ncbi:hypothetical protein FXV83_38370 [Bradyrhizobium hipponense]|uniref:PNPLA domain-containing protein n=1 Tax=Bradyrhizobium hipponense TaxID=2605638 RepID=A0A5S4YBI9_9BRAD|nr:hypothetical protein [Bradyrhizobium hipponense]TYO61383.1 hypothetical protein FXV83_38370 [Bradyrhizobium hipponense]
MVYWLVGRLWKVKLPFLSIIVGVSLLLLPGEARELFLERSGVLGHLEFCAVLLTAWSLPLYSSIRRVNNLEHNEKWSLSFATPLIAGLLPFIAVLLSISLLRRDILSCSRISDVNQLHRCFGYAPTNAQLEFESNQDEPFSGYAIPEIGDALGQLTALAVLVGLSAVFFVLLVNARRISKAMTARWNPDGTRVAWLLPLRLAYRISERGFLITCAVSTTLLVATVCWPHSLPMYLGRASLIPILAGSWVLLFEFVMMLQAKMKWAIGLVVVVVGTISAFLPTFHDVRLYQTRHWDNAQLTEAKSHGPGVDRQGLLEDAIDRWKVVNGCIDPLAKCTPRPLLVAAEGGASRAAFFTATVLGALIDATDLNNSAVDMRRSLFALSGVSGGAVGLATVRTALAESSDRHPPCRHIDPLWFGANEGHKNPARNPAESWRACLQLLTSGDYLIPAVVGLVWRDPFGLVAPHDRAVLLEQSIERHYNYVVHGTRSPCQGREDERGLCHPFGYLSQGPGHWLPLLLLNATSMDTGRPTLISDIQTGISSANCNRLFISVQNLFEMYATNPFAKEEPAADAVAACKNEGLEKAHDVRLSTAAVLSARFPVISPAGVLRFRNEFRDLETDHIVDGGYYDNSGLDTLTRLVPFLQKRGLNPLVLYLTNEPWFFKASVRAGRLRHDPLQQYVLPAELEEPKQGTWQRLLPWFEEPLDTLLRLRAGHKGAALERMLDLGDNLFPVRVTRSSFVTRWPNEANWCIDVPDRKKATSITLPQPVMSWWLSPLAQRVLDAELCNQENINVLTRVVEELQRGQTN